MNSLFKRIADTIRALVLPQRHKYTVSGWKPCWGDEWKNVVSVELRRDPAAEKDASFRFLP